METVPIIAGAYLLGAVPTTLLIPRFGSGVDIRTVGSGNIGTVNSFKEEVGTQAGALVLLADVAKGMLVMVVILSFDFSPELATAETLAITIGHNFSVFLRFEGGKGFAVVFGLSLVVFPILALLSLVALPGHGCLSGASCGHS